jgi:phosphatidylinositol glycan class K
MIVSSSRYWFNYRHVINALSIYQLIKANGIPDSNIVLMLADEYAVNPRNPFKNRMLAAGPNGPTLFDADVQIDYRGDDVRVESFVRALTGRSLLLPLQDQNLQNGVDQPVLATDQDSNILIYLTGHGGDSFFKFQDAEEVLASQLASALAHMHERGQYRHVLLLADTCQAFTLGDAIASPNVTIVGSSLRGESSYAHHSDDVLGLSVIERYTHTLVEFLRGKSLDSLTLQQGLIDPYPFATQRAHVGANDGMSVLKMNQMRMSDFFAASTVAVPKNAATNGAPMKIISDSERILFSQVSPMMDESLQKYQRLSNELPTMAANWNDDRRIFAGVKIATCEHGLFPRRAGAGAEATDSMFLALVTVLIGSIVWSFLLFLATNRNRR